MVKAHWPDIQSLRGHVPVRVLHQLYDHPQAPVIRTLITWFDQPSSPLALESYINVAEPDQRNDFQDLAERPELRFFFYDASLQHRLTKVVPNHDRAIITQIVATADELRSSIPEATYDFDVAKAAVMERTSL